MNTFEDQQRYIVSYFSALGTVSGMIFLGAQNVVHRDLALRNILYSIVNKQYVAKGK